MKLTSKTTSRKLGKKLLRKSKPRLKLEEHSPINTDVDVLLAARYTYYCLSESIMSDVEYDTLEKATIATNRGISALNSPGSDSPDDYPFRVKLLAKYFLTLKIENQIAKADHGKDKKENGATLKPRRIRQENSGEEKKHKIGKKLRIRASLRRG